MRQLTLAKLQKNNLVAQANALIQSKYKITRGEHLLLMAMISLIDPKDKEFLTFRTTTDQVAKILGTHPATALREFDKITTRLMSRVLTIYTKDGWDKFQWVSSAKVRGNIISLKFHDDLKPYLLELKKSGNFTQYRLGGIIWFKSVYTSRIYQLLKEYSSKRIKNISFSLNDFREMMLGEGATTYPLYKNFRNYILDVAKRELETLDAETGFFKSDLSFDLETRRTGRKISHLKFIIRKQKTAPIKQLQIEIPPDENPHQNTPEYKALLLIAISETHAQGFLEQYGADYIAEKLQVLTERQQIEDIKSPSGFFIKALNEDYKSEKLQKQQREQERRAREEEKRQLEQLEKRKQELSGKFGKLERKAFIISLSEDKKAEILKDIKVKYNEINIMLKQIEKDGLESMVCSLDINLMIPEFEAKRETYIKKNLAK